MMRHLVIFFTLGTIFSGCGVQNSVNNDASIYSNASQNTSGSAAFQQARAVMVRSCFQCHTTWSTYTEDQFKGSSRHALVVAGQPAQSQIYTELRGSGGEGGSMPPQYQLSDADLQAIYNWIAQM